MKLNIKLILAILITLVFANNQLIAQNNSTHLKGLVKHNDNYLQDINILNLSTKLGSSSNKFGNFTINASLGDSIQFSSLVFKSRTIRISEGHINSKSITVYLEADFNELEEVMLDKKVYLSSINLAITEGTIFDNDKVSSSKAPDARKFTDPNAKGGGINFVAIFKQFTKKERFKRKRRELEMKKIKQLKKEFSVTIRNQYGNSFFKEWLHISEDKINLFLEYCNEKGLAELYNNDEFIIKNFLVKHAKIFNTFGK